MQLYDELKTYYREKAKNTHHWTEYKNFIDSYAKFKYSYAVSVHKAQGASIKNVYVFEGEIMGVKPISIKEKFQSLYVATTRAMHRVYIFNKQNSVNNSMIKITKKMFLNENT
jgi:ATP-dependent exoDNAse (exonuclease V) alpha subunit